MPREPLYGPGSFANERIPALGPMKLYTESYAGPRRANLTPCSRSFRKRARGDAAELGINAGHDLNLNNLRDFRIPNLLRSRCHAFTIDALRWGIPETVRRYLETLSAL